MENKQVGKYLGWLAGLFFLLGLFAIGSLDKKQDFNLLIGLIPICFIAYYWLVKSSDFSHLRLVFFLSVIVCCWQYPYLSNDYFRFLWDGEIMHLGFNPYDFTPNQLIQQKVNLTCYHLDLYAGMSELSQGNYSCYPSFNQLYFYFSTGMFEQVFINLLILRILILLSVLLGWYYLNKILDHLHLSKNYAYFLYLNPLFLLETFGNVHFEGAMLSFLFAGLYFLIKKDLLKSGIFISLAVQLKLIPLLLLPFVLRYLGWGKSMRLYTFVFVFSIVGFLLLLNLKNIPNFMESLALYFQNFEFNSFVLYPYLQYGEWKLDWNMTKYYAPQLAKWSLIFILGIAFYGGEVDEKTMLKRMFLGFLVYLMLTSTVHPWYWIVPLGLSVFHPNKTIILACLTTFLSYGLYPYGLKSDYRLFLMFLNLGVIVFGIYELWWSDRKLSF